MNPFFEFSSKFGTSSKGITSLTAESKLKKVYRNRIKQFVDEKMKKKKKKGFLNFFDESELSTETMEGAFAFPGKVFPGIALSDLKTGANENSNANSGFFGVFQNADYDNLNYTLNNSIIPSLDMDLLIKFLQTKGVMHVPSLMQGFEALCSWNKFCCFLFFACLLLKNVYLQLLIIY